MKLRQLILKEAQIARKILKDPKTTKMLAIAWRHDGTLPRRVVAKLGPPPRAGSPKEVEYNQAVVQEFSDLLDNLLRDTNYGDLSADGRFDDWIVKQYINGQADYEDIAGEAKDALGAWKLLSQAVKRDPDTRDERNRVIRGAAKLDAEGNTIPILKPQHRDLSKFRTIKQLHAIINDRSYRDDLFRVREAEKIEQMKKDAKQVVLINDNRFSVIVPLNYGSCYSTDKSGGFIPNFCTGSSDGASWFKRYAPDGMIVNIIDKENLDSVDGKWQFHAATNQLVRGDQERRHDLRYNDERFADMFPGLMKRIVAAIQSHAEEIVAASQDLTEGGYNIPEEIAKIKNRYPLAYASGEDVPEPAAAEPEAQAEPEPAADPDTLPGTYLVTQIASGRAARIGGESKADVIQKVLARYPTSTEADYTFVREPDEEQA